MWILADGCEKVNTAKIATTETIVSFVWVRRFFVHGTHILSVSVSTGGGVVTSQQRLTILPPIPSGLQVTLDPEVRDTPTCVPSHLPDGHVTVYTSAEVRFIASLNVGFNLTFAWSVNDKLVDIIVPHTNCTGLDCRRRKLVHSFFSEGVSKVAVNASNSHGWAHQLIHVLAINYQLTDVRVSIPDGNRIAINSPVTLVITAYTTRYVDNSIHINFGDDTYFNHSLQSASHENVTVTYDDKCNLLAEVKHVFSREGDYVVNVTISDASTTIAEHAALKACNVLDQGIAVGDEYAAVHLPVELLVHLTTPTSCPLRVRWRIYNSTGSLTESRRTHSLRWHPKFRYPGSYRIEATVENAISSFSFQHNVLVQEPIRGLSVQESGTAVCQTGKPYQISITYAAGTDVSCRWSTRQMSGRHVVRSPNGCNTTWIFHKPESIALDVAVSNLVSQKEVTHTLNVVEPLYGLYVCAPKRLASNDFLNVTVLLLKGSHFNISASDGVVTRASDRTYNVTKLVDTPGTVNLSVNARNPISHLTRLVEIEVTRKLEDTLSFKQLRENKDSSVYVVDGFPTENLLYSWKLSDGSFLYTSVPVVEVPSRENHVVAAIISNEVSSVSAHAWTHDESNPGTPRLVHSVVATAKAETEFTLQKIPLEVNYNKINVTYAIRKGRQTVYQTYIKAISSPSPLERWNHFFSEPSEVFINITLSSGKDDLVLSSFLSVQSPLADLKIEGPNLVPCLPGLPLVYDWYVHAIPESNIGVVYAWEHDGKWKITAERKASSVLSCSRTHTLKFRAWNGLSQVETSFTVKTVLLISEVDVTVSTSVAGKPSSIHISYKGTPDVNASVSFGDGTREILKARKSLSANVFDITLEHRYNNKGHFDVNVNVSNEVSWMAAQNIADVGEPITGAVLTLMSPATVALLESVMVEATVATGTELTFNWDFGDDNGNQYTSVESTDKSSVARHSYGIAKTYNISVNITNRYHDNPVKVYLSTPVHAIERIAQLRLCTVGNIGAAPLLKDSHRDQQSASSEEVMSTPIVLFEAQVYWGSDVEFLFDFGDGNKTVVPSRLGTLSLRATALCGHVYHKEGVYIVRVTASNPLGALNISLDDPFYVQIPPTELRFNETRYITLLGKPVVLKTAISSGTNVSYDWCVGNSECHKDVGAEIILTFDKTGKYNITVEAYNQVTELSRYMNRLSAFTDVYVQELLQAVEICIVLKHGTICEGNEVDLPLDEKVLLIANALPSTEVALKFVWNLGYLERTTNSRSYRHLYREPGVYAVNVTAKNDVSSVSSGMIVLHLIQRISNLTSVRHQPSILVNHTTSFHALYWFGTNLTFQWDFGDGTEIAFTHAANTQHTYKRSGEYWLSLLVYNQFSSAFIKTNIFALEQHCQKPEVKFVDQILDRKVENYQDLLIETDVIISCDLTNGVVYEWKVLRIEENSEVKEIDFLPPELLIRQQLIIPKYSLPVGKYLVRLKVQMEGTIVYVVEEIEIDVIPSNLIAFWKGGIWRSIGFKDNVSLNVITNINSTEDSIHWRCSTVHSTHHSCFKHRAPYGTIDYFDPHIDFLAEELNSDLASMSFNLNIMHEGKTQLSSAEDAHSSVILELTEEAHLLPIVIRRIHHLHHRIRQDDKIVFLATCDGCQDIPLEFHWKLWLVEDGNHDLFISRYSCVQADGSTFFIHADNSTLNLTNESGRMTSELPYLQYENEETEEDELPFPPPLDFPTSENDHANQSYFILTEVYKKREVSEDIYERLNPEEKPTISPLFPYPPVEGDVIYEDTYPRGSDNLQIPLSEQDYFGPFLLHDSHRIIDEGLPGEAGSASERDQVDLHKLDGDGIIEGLGNGRVPIGKEVQTTNKQKYPDPKNVGDTVRDSQYQSTAPHLALRPRVPYPLEHYPVSPEYFVIEPGNLQIGGTFIVEASVKSKDGLFGKAMDYIVVNMGPTNGRCTLVPLKGEEFETWFRLHCMEWKSDNSPLSYELRYSLTQNVSGHIIYSGLNGNSKFTLPAGLPQNNYSVYVDVIVRDRKGTGTRVCSIERQVLPKWHNLRDMELFIHDEVTDPLSLFNKMVGEQNWQAVLHQIHVWGRGLSHFVNVASRDRSKRDLSSNGLRKRLLHLINTLKILNEVEAHQASSAILALLEIPVEISLAELTDSFEMVKKFLDKKLYSIIPLDSFQEGIVRVISHIINSAVDKMLTAEASEFLKLKSLIEQCKIVISDIMKGKLMDLLPNEKPFTFETPEFSVLTGYLANSNPHLNLVFGKTQIVIGHQVYLDIFNVTSLLHSCRKNHSYSCGCVIVTAESSSKSPYISEMMQTPDGNSRLQISGGVSSLVFSSCDKYEPIELPHPEIEFHLSRQQVDPEKHHTLNYNDLHFHQLNLTKEQINNALMVSIHIINLEVQEHFPLMLLFSFNLPPHPNKYMKKEIFKIDDHSIKLLIPADLIKESGLYYLAILDAHYIIHSQNNDNLSPVNYTLSASLEQCLVWSQRDECWSPEGCIVSETTEVDSIHCRCQRLDPVGYNSQILSTELQIVSVDRYLGRAVNILPIIIIFLVYFTSLILCHYFGGNDSKKMPLVVLKDNNHKQGYLIIIETGSYWDAGTTAMVCIILHGENGMSETIPLFSSRDSSLTFFQRSSINTFFVSTQNSLGHLWKIQVWHNNSGSSPSWYLKNISVFDMNTGQPYCFECEQWLSVEEEDGQIEKEIPLNETAHSFARVYQENFLSCLTDYHIWSSIYSKPTYSSFTRVQRITCCFSFTMMSCAVIAIWYKYGYNYHHYFDHSVLGISWQTILIGVVSGLLAMLPHQFLSFLFRSSTLPQTTLLSYLHPLFSGWSWKAIYCSYQQKDANSTVNSAEPFSSVNSESIYSSDSLSHYDDSVEYADDGSEGYTDGVNFNMLISSNLDGLDTFIKNQYGYYSSWESYGGIPAENEFSDLNKKKDLLSEQLKSDSLRTNGTAADIKMQDINRSDQTSSGFEDWQEKTVTDNTDTDEYHNSIPRTLFKRLYHWKFPSWVQSLTWFLLLSSAGISAYLTIIYVYRFGSQYFSWWLQSLFYCILSSVFVLHPLWIGILALISSIKSWSLEDISTYVLSRFDTSLLEELSRIDYQFKMSEESLESDDEKLMKRQWARYLRYLRPPPETTLIQARIKALKTKHIIFAIKGVSASAIMFILLLIMAYGKHVNHNFYQRASIEKAFMRTATFPASSIKSHSEWWNWVRHDFLDVFYGTPSNYNTFFNDPNASMLFYAGSISVGTPMIHSYFSSSQPCSELNTFSSECPSYFALRNKTMDENHHYRSFQGRFGYYRSAVKPLYLKTNRKEAYEQLKILYNKNWIDNRTRAVTVDFLLYNPTTAMFISVSVAVEFPSVGGAVVSSLILPSQLHQCNISHGNLMIAFQLMFQIMVFWTLKKELWKMWKMGQSFWSLPWRLLQLSFCLMSIIYSACSTFRTVLVTSSLHKHEQASYEFYSYVRDIGEWDQVLNGQLGLLIFLHMIGWLEFLHLSSRIGQFLHAFSFVQKDIITLMGIFFILLLGFAHVGNIAFGSDAFVMKNPILQSLQVLRLLLHQSVANKSSTIGSVASELYNTLLLFGIFGTAMIGLAMIKAIIIRSKQHTQPKKEVCVGVREMMQLLQEKIVHSLGLSKKRDLQFKEISIPPAELLLMELESLVDEVFVYANKLFTDNGTIDDTATGNEDKKEENCIENSTENEYSEWCNSHQVVAELHYCSSAQISCDEVVSSTDNIEDVTEERHALNGLETCDDLSTHAQ